jgi:hypothetical protein
MLKKIVIITTVVSLCLLALLLNTTVPTEIGPFGILAVFILAYASSLGVVAYFLFAVSYVLSRASIAFTAKSRLGALTFRRAYYYSTVISAAPVMLIALQSVGAIGPYEVILVLIFALIGCVYIAKRIR